jgi:hypothetical protein
VGGAAVAGGAAAAGAVSGGTAGAVAGGASAGASSGGGAAGSAAASEGLGMPAKIGIATAVAVAAGVGLAFALSGGTPPHKPAAKPAPRPVASSPAPPRRPTPPPPTPSPQPVAPAPVPAAVVKPSPRPRPTPPAPTPTPTPTPAPTPPPPPPPRSYYLDALPFQGVSNSGGPAIEPNALGWVWQRPSGVSIGGTTYKRGVTTVAPSGTVIELNRSCSLFTASVGVDDMTMGLGAANFTVEDAGSGAVLWRSPVIHGGDPAVPVSVSLKGLTSIRLIARGSHGFLGGQVADWADAAFTC